ncbi:MAG: hypothetical protein H7836_13275 [Magnetococcus sp. YQC-3]
MVNIFQSSQQDFLDSFQAIGENNSDPRVAAMARRTLLGRRDPVDYSTVARPARAGAERPTPQQRQENAFKGNMNSGASQVFKENPNNLKPMSGVPLNIFADFFGVTMAALSGNKDAIKTGFQGMMTDAQNGFQTNSVHNPFTNQK